MGAAGGDEEEGQQELLRDAEPQPEQWRPGGQQREPAEHRIPLPATELGDTALVTTKTVKEGD